MKVISGITEKKIVERRLRVGLGVYNGGCAISSSLGAPF